MWTAELARHDEVAAEAAVTWSIPSATTRFASTRARFWARHTEMLLRRLGGHDRLWGWFYNNRGAMRMRQGRLAESLEDGRRAVAAKEKVGGLDSTDVALSVANMAVGLDQMGETTEAAIYAERALRILEGGLGPQHPRTALVSSNYAEILNQLGRFDEARAMAQRALDALEGEVDATGSFITFPLMALARAHLGAGQAAAALPLLERVAGSVTRSAWGRLWRERSISPSPVPSRAPARTVSGRGRWRHAPAPSTPRHPRPRPRHELWRISTPGWPAREPRRSPERHAPAGRVGHCLDGRAAHTDQRFAVGFPRGLTGSSLRSQEPHRGRLAHSVAYNRPRPS